MTFHISASVFSEAYAPALAMIAPALMFLVAVLSAWMPGKRPRFLIGMAEIAALSATAISICALAALIWSGNGTGEILSWKGLGLTNRVDWVSVPMLVLVSFIGWIVLRYSATYLDGEARQGAFIGWMSATLGSVMLLVQSGNLLLLSVCWIATGLFLGKLLLFYPHRAAARRAARKKFIVARIGDGALVSASLLLFTAYGNGDIAHILEASRGGEASIPVLVAIGLLAFAALLKSAQFPFHGWLTEVMETPTPVSALLHAGIVNAGGFLLVRFADVMLLSPGVLAVLVMIGGFSALFGSVVMLTQPAVKNSLAWSTIAQMGFMTMQCGLALFPLALLHIIAHSLYKAHAFLSSGNAVENVSFIRRPGPIAVPSLKAVARSFLIALCIYAAIGALFGFDGKSPQAIALGAILILGVAYLLAQGLADAAPRALTLRTAISSLAASVSYFMLQKAVEWLTADTLPATPAPGPLEWALIVLALFTFAGVAVGQATFPLWSGHPAVTGLRVHLSNGFYVNALLDRMVDGWSVQKSRSRITATAGKGDK